MVECVREEGNGELVRRVRLDPSWDSYQFLSIGAGRTLIFIHVEPLCTPTLDNHLVYIDPATAQSSGGCSLYSRHRSIGSQFQLVFWRAIRRISASVLSDWSAGQAGESSQAALGGLVRDWVGDSPSGMISDVDRTISKLVLILRLLYWCVCVCVRLEAACGGIRPNWATSVMARMSLPGSRRFAASSVRPPERA